MSDDKNGTKKKVQKTFEYDGNRRSCAPMLVFVSVASMGLKVQNTKKQARIEELNALIAEEEERAKEIEEYGKYVQTKKYAEEVAKEKLGLVYEDEIIFKAED